MNYCVDFDGTIVIHEYPEVGESEWKFFGKWYKPWTWLRWSKLYTINEFKLWDFSFISNPTDSNTVMKIEDNDE